MLTLLLPLVAAFALQDAPPLFQDWPLDTALERGADSKRLVLVDATASWCKSCRAMDTTTWLDDGVVAWANEHGLCLQLDLDADILMRRQLKVSAYPTLIMFRDGVELDRVVGARTAGDFLSWVNGLANGSTTAGTLESQVRATLKSASWEERAGRFGSLVDATLDTLATQEMQRIWSTLDEFPSNTPNAEELSAKRYQRIRIQLRGPMRALVLRHPEARAAITSLRDATTPESPQTATGPELSKWIELNYVLDDERQTVTWIMRQERAGDSLEALAPFRDRLFDPLMNFGLARVAGRFVRSPMIELKRLAANLTALDAQTSSPDAASGAGRSELFGELATGALAQGRNAQQRLTAQFRLRGAKLYAALLAADRAREAEPVSRLLLETVDDKRTRLELLNWTVEANAIGRARQRHKVWIRYLYEH